MSSGPTGTKPFKPTRYYNTEITIEDFCSFDGICPVAVGTYIGVNPCYICIYKKNINIPALLEERNKK